MSNINTIEVHYKESEGAVLTLSLSREGRYVMTHPGDETMIRLAAECLQCSVEELILDASSVVPATEHGIRLLCRSMKDEMTAAAAKVLHCDESELLFERQGLRRLWTGEVAGITAILQFLNQG